MKHLRRCTPEISGNKSRYLEISKISGNRKYLVTWEIRITLYSSMSSKIPNVWHPQFQTYGEQFELKGWYPARCFHTIFIWFGYRRQRLCWDIIDVIWYHLPCTGWNYDIIYEIILLSLLPAGAVLDKAISLRVFAEKTSSTLITAIAVVLNCFL